jgi:hypothetical protein
VSDAECLAAVMAVLDEHRTAVEQARRAVAQRLDLPSERALVAVDETVRAAVSKEWP